MKSEAQIGESENYAGREHPKQGTLEEATKKLAVATIVLAIAEIGTLLLMAWMLSQNEKVIKETQGTSTKLGAALTLFCQSLTTSPDLAQVFFGPEELSPDNSNIYKIRKLESASDATIVLGNTGPLTSKASVKLLLRRGLKELQCPAKEEQDLLPGQYGRFLVDVRSCLREEGVSATGIASFRIVSAAESNCQGAI